MENFIIIGVSGKLGSGKDFIVNHLLIPLLEEKGVNPIRIGFADQLKVNVMTKFNIAYKHVFDDKTPEARRLLQTEGTAEREKDPDIWIKYVQSWIRVHSNRGVSVFIIPDVRYKNEHTFVKTTPKHILLRIDSPHRNHDRLLNESKGDPDLYEKIKTHPSECDLDETTDFHLVVKNDPEFKHLFSFYRNQLREILEEMI